VSSSKETGLKNTNKQTKVSVITWEQAHLLILHSQPSFQREYLFLTYKAVISTTTAQAVMKLHIKVSYHVWQLNLRNFFYIVVVYHDINSKESLVSIFSGTKE